MFFYILKIFFRFHFKSFVFMSLCVHSSFIYLGNTMVKLKGVQHFFSKFRMRNAKKTSSVPRVIVIIVFPFKLYYFFSLFSPYFHSLIFHNIINKICANKITFFYRNQNIIIHILYKDFQLLFSISICLSIKG